MTSFGLVPIAVHLTLIPFERLERQDNVATSVGAAEAQFVPGLTGALNCLRRVHGLFASSTVGSHSLECEFGSDILY